MLVSREVVEEEGESYAFYVVMFSEIFKLKLPSFTFLFLGLFDLC
jgi:hypothetical protein